MDLKRLSSGSPFEELAAYSRAVVDDLYIHVSGTVGPDPETGAMPEDPAEQARNILRLLATVLAAEGADFSHVVRNRVFLTDASDVMAVAAVLRDYFADCRPANTTLINGIPAPGAKVEIEITARRPAA
ncbi:MAG: RidA family protein [Rhizorhabdus sp.]|jgi:enamine deaminase RidA (YjgF/YER057c/UK114 family)|uniref:RidA family protein n=1 Tax=Rhizorhabdus sp. TaxID=1968843 RepID=UPI001B3CF71A|nr:RidA family protein [Rhizorhabdus sp.]MBP8233451.1 RidA family protein [Rhizorhabdus sp.]